MSFVTGFVAGVGAGEVYESKKVRRHLRAYLQEHGIALQDQHGQEISIDALLDEAVPTRAERWLLIAGVGVWLLLLSAAGLSLLLFL